MKNRTIIGIVCIVLALVVTFAVAPLVNKLSDSRTDIVRLKSDIVQGHMIQESDIEIVTAGSTGLPANVITKKEAVVGKFAACDLKANTDLLQSMISDKSDSADDVFHCGLQPQAGKQQQKMHGYFRMHHQRSGRT